MPPCLVVDPTHPDPDAIAAAAAVLRAGGLVAFPTETVYGLGADARSAPAVARIFAAKGRPADDPIIVHILGVAALGLGGEADGANAVVADWPPVAQRLADAFWPGPLTLIVPRGSGIPPIVTAGLDRVAVRAPAHQVARALLAAAGRPIAAPSANPFGRTSPTTAAHVIAGLGDAVDLVLDGGPCGVGVESTVVDCTTDPIRVLRPGGVPLEAIRAIVPDAAAAPVRAPSGGPLPSPGTLDRHYAPRARLVLVTGGGAVAADIAAAAATVVPGPIRRAARGGRGRRSDRRRRGRLADRGRRGRREDRRRRGRRGRRAGVRPPPRALAEPAIAARRLFAALHELDALGVDVILARDWPAAELGRAVSDRLRRAAGGAPSRRAAGRRRSSRWRRGRRQPTAASTAAAGRPCPAAARRASRAR
ncbi:MAG: L-threonylcarbamoyladenylate synthase [Anaerolineae bacterium]